MRVYSNDIGEGGKNFLVLYIFPRLFFKCFYIYDMCTSSLSLFGLFLLLIIRSSAICF